MAATPIVRLPFNGSSSGTGTTPVTAALSAASYVPGRVGNQALNFSGIGQAEILQKVVPLSSTYTLCFWVKVNEQTDGPNASWLLYKFSGVNRFLYIDMASRLTRWSFIVIIQDTNKISAYLNGELRGQEAMPTGWGKPTGFALVNDSKATSGFMTLEDLTLYPGADYSQIQPLIPTPRPNMDIQYSVNGTNFKNYGVVVSASKGVVDALAMKDPLRYEWPDYHGEVIDLSNPRYQPRPITLTCFIKTDGVDDFIERVAAFVAQFQKPNTQRLRLSAYSLKPHVFEVYLPGTVELNKKWSDRNMFGTFELTLIEPDPVKRVLSFGAGTVSITLTSKLGLTIHWGDGQRTFDVFGQGVTVTHTYETAGPHEIIVSGVIENITAFSSTAGTVWNKL